MNNLSDSSTTKLSHNEVFLCFEPTGLMDHSWMVAHGDSSDATLGDVVEEMVRDIVSGIYQVTISIELQRTGAIEDVP